MPPYTLFGIEGSSYEDAKVAVLPVPYDSTSSYKVGSREGPRAIIEASRNLEPYSEELGEAISDRIGIFTLEELAPDFNGPEGMVNRIAKEVGLILEDRKLPLLLGGEHTIAVGAVRAIAKSYDDFSVLHFDAHADSRDELNNTKYSHACVMARIREMCKSCYSVGIRSTDKESAKRYKNDTLYRKDMHKMGMKEIVDDILKHTKKKVYLTVDLDVIDPSEMPSTGTPEPDGLSFHEMAGILKGVLAKRDLIGADFTELSPAAGLVAPNFLAAKLIYLALGYAFVR
jgi:agmatinase